MNISLARPLLAGVGRVTQWFGENPENYKQFGLAGHNGVDYGAPAGSPVVAMHDGLVKHGWDPKGYGNYVILEEDDYSTLYAHLSGFGVPETGDWVTAGTVIGTVGSTGNSTGPHLHVELRITGIRNPAYKNRIDLVPFRDGPTFRASDQPARTAYVQPGAGGSGDSRTASAP